MEINIGVMCSCMPAMRPLFVRVMPRVSLHSLRATLSRSRHVQENEQAQEGPILEMGRYQEMNANNSDSTGRSPTTEFTSNEGARNMIAF